METAAAPGYDKDSVTYSPETFTISTEDTQGVVVTATNLPLADKPPVEPVELTGSVSLKKVDQADPQKTLENAAFRLYERQPDGTVFYYKDANNGLPLWSADPAEAQTFTTDAQGMITVDHLLLGTYYFEEVTPPEGYRLSTTALAFTLDEDNIETGKSVIFENTKSETPPPDPETPKTPATPEPQKPAAGKTAVGSAAGANPKTGIADISAAVTLLLILAGGSAGIIGLKKRR